MITLGVSIRNVSLKCLLFICEIMGPSNNLTRTDRLSGLVIRCMYRNLPLVWMVL